LGEPDANRHRFLAGCFSSYRAGGLVRLKSAETTQNRVVLNLKTAKLFELAASPGVLRADEVIDRRGHVG
jgi:hypothetical protein